ncbi:PhzF family phenazine biosynthesis protein [Arenimonas sp.]|uniref:PhzF family phenazine biosynthesis protein n=1 Tax=Arenimonas sp. TaxID=1872635 RepID=UPI0039E38222
MRAVRRFLQLDVFADRPGLGNPLAVVLDSEGLDGAGMQAFARWTNLSETIFLLPPSLPGASYRVRIFTPRTEMPFAGHPSVGAAHALLETGIEAKDGELWQECEAGLLPVRFESHGAGRRISVRAPRARVLGVDVAPHLLDAAITGMRRGALPIALLDNGPRWWLVELEGELAVRELQPALDAIAALCSATLAAGLMVFARAASGEAAFVTRAFCPADGVDEDPVTGSANACVAAWLRHNGALPWRRYSALQGREIGRDGRIDIQVDADDEVWIGGRALTVVRGEMRW